MKTQSKEDKEYLFEQMPIGRAILKMSVPTVIACIVMILYNLADTYFVGRLNNPVQTAAVTLGATVILAFNAITNLFGVGASSLMSRALGVKDYDTFKRTSSFGFYCSLILALLLSLGVFLFMQPLLHLLGADPENMEATRKYLNWTVVHGAIPAILNIMMSYLVRSEGSALHASIGSMSGCILNILLDPFFILPWGLNLGASGAGLATFISNCVAFIYFLVFLRVKKGKTFVSINIKDFKPGKYIVKEVFLVGVPASIQNLLNVTGMTILNNFVSEFGSEAVAAMGISHKTTMIPMYIAMGISQGVMPLIGYSFSAGNRKRMKDAIWTTARISAGFLILATIGFYIFAPNIIGVFMKNETIVAYGAAFVRGMCLAQPFLSLDFLGVGVYQACGMGQKSLIFAICRKLVLEIPALVVLNKLFPMYGLAYAQLFAEVILAVAATIVLVKIVNAPAKESTVKDSPQTGQ